MGNQRKIELMTSFFRNVLASMLFASLLVLAACQKLSDGGDESNQLGKNTNNQFVTKDAAPIASKYKKDSELMFNVMAAEIAGYRQNMKQSVEFYLKAIKMSEDPKLAERAARIALYAKDNKSALIASQRWAELAPKNPEPHRFLAILHLRLADTEKSLAELKKFYSMMSGSKNVKFSRIISLYSQEADRKRAYEVIKTFIGEHKKNEAALFDFSRFALQMHKYDDALSSIDSVLKLKPNWHQAKLLRARILMSSGHKEKAIAEMRNVLKANPNSKPIRINYARLLTEAKRYDEAKQQFEVLLKRKPKDADILYALALLSMESKQFNQANKYLKRMIDTGRRKNEGYYHLGLIAEELRQYDAAIAWLTKVQHSDRQIDAHLRIASIMSKKGDVEAARRYLYQLKPRTKRLEVRLYLAEADILNRAKRHQDAMDVINNALGANPGNFDLLYARAMLAEKMDNLELLEKDLKAILKKNPKNAQALNALGYTLADRTKRYKEAYDYIKQAFELAPDQAAIIDSMGWVLYRMGNYSEAVKHLEKALNLDNNAEIAAHLGEVLWVMGDKKKAIKAWEKGKKIDKTNKTLRSTLKRFNQ